MDSLLAELSVLNGCGSLQADPPEIDGQFFEGELFDGVMGYTVDCGHKGLYVPFLMSANPRQGNVGRYLDSLKQTGQVIKVPNIISDVLQGMLERRDFKLTWEYAEEYNDNVDVWVWDANEHNT